MDLYGDLPPASGGETTVQAVAGWTQSQSSTMRPRQIPANENVTIAEPAAVSKTHKPAFVPSATKLLPKAVSNLAFRPRQAATPKVMNLPATTTTTMVASAPSFINDNPVLYASEEMTSKAKPKENKKNVQEKEFNDNFSFDVEDAYDPRKPNDYIAYCEERLEAKRLEKLQEENKLKLVELEQMREENAKQRKLAVESGDYSSLLSSSINQNRSNASDDRLNAAPAGRGRGVGRGLVNLPAWMTQKMESEGTLGSAGATSSAPTSDNKDNSRERFEDASHADKTHSRNSTTTAVSSTAPSVSMANVIGMKRKAGGGFNRPSCVVLLKNMVSPDDVDDMLTEETKQECLNYGAVKECIIYQVPARDPVTGIRCPDEERVRLFVVFEQQESAVKAFRDLNGRFFGGRQITASFYDEDKYESRDLAPNMGEW